MGKNSTSLHNKSQKDSSVHSLHSQKSKKSKRKKRNRTKKNIKKLFNQLRNNNETSSSTSNTTVIEIDESTVINNTLHNNNNNRNDSNLIEIKDDNDLVINNNTCYFSNVANCLLSPLHCSTPIAKRSNRVLNSKTSVNGSPNNKNESNLFNEDVINLTKEINKDSYLTIDLTTESTNKTEATVIDLANTSDTVICKKKSTSSMSGDSDVTVINLTRNTKLSRGMEKFQQGIARMDASEKSKLLELITQKIFNGCKVPSVHSLHSLKKGISQTTETAEDTYIKEVILGGETKSRNSIGSNIYNPQKDSRNKTGLRMIIIDGSNVAMQHTKGRIFSVEGLKICIDYFLQRGHTVKAFVPHFRCKYGKSTNGRLLDQLERQGLVVYTPSREVKGRMISSYDDRYIVQCAAEFDGVIVSSDYYRDLLLENPRWRVVIENRLLQFTWVGDMIMFPRDPLGRMGPSLQDFLRHPRN